MSIILTIPIFFLILKSSPLKKAIIYTFKDMYELDLGINWVSSSY